MTRYLLCLFYTLAAVAMAGPAVAQTLPPAPPVPADSPPQRLRVYLDCSDCFQEYLRDEIDWVDFVRQREDADVHLLSNDTDTGSGGTELVLRFVGVGRFQGLDQELRVVSLVNEAENAERARVLRTVSVGLLHYLARAGLPAGLDVNVEVGDADDAGGVRADDKWNLWVFEISAGAQVEPEQSNRQAQWDTSVTADRVSEAWKISFGVSLEEEHENFELEGEAPLDVDQRERSFEWFAAKSLGPHWSLGLDGSLESSTFGNLEFGVQAAPAVEFSVFPYSEYATRQFVFQYQVGIEHAKYYEVTLFDEIEETLARQQVSASLDQNQTWGTLQTSLEWSQYLHDLSKYRVDFEGELSVRIVRGLSIEIEGSASRLRDQLSIPRRGATQEEVLLELRELQSTYDVSFSVGLSYSFGSIFNNIVNPRFDD